ncbi:MAG: hypothetical protein RL456_2741 [Pseudomonadota bacterium]|jgi:hypothetical protein
MTTKNIDELAFALENAKAAEDQARNVRLEAEAALIEAVGLKDEGSQSVKTDWYVVSTTQPISYSFTPAADAELKVLPADVVEAVRKVKYEVSVSGLKKLATANPDMYRLVSAVVIAKPGKPAAKVKRLAGPARKAA